MTKPKTFTFPFFTNTEGLNVIHLHDEDVLLVNADFDEILLQTDKEWIAGTHTFEYCLDYSKWTVEVYAQTKMKLIDMYAKSQRNRQTNLCIRYAKKRAQQWLGPNAWHECDESCDHKQSCEGCKYYSPDEHIPRGVEDMTCLRP